MADKPHFSATRLNMHSRCGEQERRRYVDLDIIPPGIAWIRGGATHKSVERNLLNKIMWGKLLPIDAVQTEARDAVVRAFDDEVLLTEIEAKEGIGIVKARTIDGAVRLATLHAEVKAPKLKPTHVERAWRIELEGFPRDLIGFIDVQEGASAVRDTKTAKKTPATSEVETSLQLTMYSLAVKVLDGWAPEHVCIDALVDSKVPKVVTLIGQRGEGHYAALLRRVEQAAIAVEKGVFTPARPDDWCCNPNYCGYYPTCPYAHGRTVHSFGG